MDKLKLLNTTVDGYTLTQELGDGASATVFKGVSDDGRLVAVKVFQQSMLRKNKKYYELINTQIAVLKEAQSQNIISYYHHSQTSDFFFIFLEYCDGEDLQKYIKKKKRVSESQATLFLKQILNGFKGLHKAKAMHRDFKAANILLHRGMCKIADLGYAKKFSDIQFQANTFLGTPLTMAPQVMERKRYGMEADIYSVGVVFYHLIYGKVPYEAKTYEALLNKIKKHNIDFSAVEISKEAKDLINRCLEYDVDKRISWLSLFQHPLIVKEDKKNLYSMKQKEEINKSQIKQIYRSQLQGDQIFKNLERNQDIKNRETLFKKKNNEEIQMLKQQGEKLQFIYRKISQYQKKYLSYKNELMFIFKFIQPYSKSLKNIKANHQLTLFLTEKKAYLEMNKFLTAVQEKKNIFQLQKFFQDFLQSEMYENVLGILTQTRFMMEIQIYQYLNCIDQTTCNSAIRNELNDQEWKNPKWNQLISDQLDSYWFLLAQALESITQQTERKNLLKALCSIQYYKNNKRLNAQKFQVEIQQINYKEQELKVRTILKSIYET